MRTNGLEDGPGALLPPGVSTHRQLAHLLADLLRLPSVREAPIPLDFVADGMTNEHLSALSWALEQEPE